MEQCGQVIFIVLLIRGTRSGLAQFLHFIIIFSGIIIPCCYLLLVLYNENLPSPNFTHTLNIVFLKNPGIYHKTSIKRKNTLVNSRKITIIYNQDLDIFFSPFVDIISRII
ncbi:MAG: hypothetical protein A2096_07505 [Spirochaetes bacterium GWF1_41_5]|nr:MAG: hypothetical protein A2096_07505 [Spirochaetes bacterium GWF1_41_5]HBE01929.1 hypothetical protein [Spirochaetia bacterium]